MSYEILVKYYINGLLTVELSDNGLLGAVLSESAKN